MFRIFAMEADGRLFQFGATGWQHEGSSFPTLVAARRAIAHSPNWALDAYIAKVDCRGNILTTFPI